VLHEEIFTYKFWAGVQIAVVKSGRKHNKNKEISSIFRDMCMGRGKAFIIKDIFKWLKNYTRDNSYEFLKIFPESTPSIRSAVCSS